MSTLFHPLRIKKIVKETADASTIYFDIPEQLQTAFVYIPGQYLTISAMVNGKEERRAYSFCTSPIADADPGITVKKVDDGTMSVYLNDVAKEGDVLQVMPPLGKFTAIMNANNRNHYYLFGGGSGITPVMSILKSVLHSEPDSVITLIYANRNETSIIFRETLERLAVENPGRLVIYHSLDKAPEGWNGHAGRLTEGDIGYLNSRFARSGFSAEYYICGPAGMMDTVKQSLTHLGIAKENIHTEYFTAPVSSGTEPVVAVAAAAPAPEDEEEEGDEYKATIIFSGREYEIVIGKGQTILEAAKEQDVDPPYACQMGVCTTCRAKMIKGEVTMDEREGLSDQEISEGYVLTCQAHPVNKRIKLIYE